MRQVDMPVFPFLPNITITTDIDCACGYVSHTKKEKLSQFLSNTFPEQASLLLYEPSEKSLNYFIHNTM